MTLGVIPARWASSRFPGKPLQPLLGKPLLEHVWRRARQCRSLDRLVVATDDARISAAARAFSAEVVMTSPAHESGTDRIAEVAAAIPEADLVLNIQGDEPLVEPALLDRLVTTLGADPALAMATAASPMDDPLDRADPNLVKVVFNQLGDALYFSRSPIPFARQSPPGLTWHRHHGLYAYRAEFLRQFVSWPPSLLERAEALEQLRALDHGARIRVLITASESIGLDTPEQVPLIEALLRADV